MTDVDPEVPIPSTRDELLIIRDLQELAEGAVAAPTALTTVTDITGVLAVGETLGLWVDGS